jgi:hypothetical protein
MRLLVTEGQDAKCGGVKGVNEAVGAPMAGNAWGIALVGAVLMPGYANACRQRLTP